MQTVFLVFGIYVLLGMLFAVPFVTIGAGRIDPNARGAGLLFRFFIFPGSVLLWPVLARKWLCAPGTDAAVAPGAINGPEQNA